MKITVIGQWGGFPPAGGATSGYWLQEDGYNLLLECGSGVVSTLQKRFDLKSLDSVLVTHFHFDHYCDLGPLLYGRLVKWQLGQLSRTLPIYGPRDPRLSDFQWEPYSVCRSFAEEDRFQLGPFSLAFLRGRHPVETYAVEVKSPTGTLLYTGDTAYFEALGQFSRQPDLLLAECSFYAGMDGSGPGHLNAADAGRLAHETGAGRLLLTHLPHFGDVKELVRQAAAEYEGPVELAESFWEREL